MKTIFLLRCNTTIKTIMVQKIPKEDWKLLHFFKRFFANSFSICLCNVYIFLDRVNIDDGFDVGVLHFKLGASVESL